MAECSRRRVEGRFSHAARFVAEQLGVGVDLGVDFEADDDLPRAGGAFDAVCAQVTSSVLAVVEAHLVAPHAAGYPRRTPETF